MTSGMHTQRISFFLPWLLTTQLVYVFPKEIFACLHITQPELIYLHQKTKSTPVLLEISEEDLKKNMMNLLLLPAHFASNSAMCYFYAQATKHLGIGMSVGRSVDFDTNFKKVPKMIYAPVNCLLIQLGVQSLAEQCHNQIFQLG